MDSMNSETPACLVLSGGGAKGMYHIGVWRALRELDVTVNAFIGNSIGAIISAFLAQGLSEELEAIGDTIGIETIVKIPGALVHDGNLRIDAKHLAAFREFSRDVLEHRGIDTSPMRRVIYDTIDEEEIRTSGVDLGLVTFNLTDMKPREVFLEDMEPGQLRDYVLASAAFPGFERPVIEGKRHMDGGVTNNLPYELALSRGYRNIIVVDLSGMGVNRRVRPEGTTTTYIKISVDIGGVLNFDRPTLERLRVLGYLDTLKVFGRLLGHSYFIEPDETWESAFVTFLERRMGAAYRKELAEKRVLPPALRHERRLLYPLLDATASALRLDRVRRYTYAELFSDILESRSRVDARVESISGTTERRWFLKTARRILAGRRSARDLPRSPYYYARLLARSETDAPRRITNRTLHTLYPELITAEFALDLFEEFTGPTGSGPPA